MKNDEDCLDIATSRRGFVRRCLGTGAVLFARPRPRHPRVTSAENARRLLVTPPPDLAEYERILGRTDRMDVLGRPRSWSLVTRGFHPFSPERIVVTPTGTDRSSFGAGYYGDRCGHLLRRRIDERIDERIEEEIGDCKRRNPGYDPAEGYFPDSKRESIYWIMDVMTDHYGVRSQFEAWVVGLVRRELLGSSAWRGCGLAHQFQHGGGDVPVDCPPVDWWLFLFPEGIGWSALDDAKLFAVIAHVGRDDQYARSGWGMLYTWALAGRVWGAVDDWAQVARMSRTHVAWHLNPITARYMGGLFQ